VIIIRSLNTSKTEQQIENVGYWFYAGQNNDLNRQHNNERVLHKKDWIVYYATIMRYFDYFNKY